MYQHLLHIRTDDGDLARRGRMIALTTLLFLGFSLILAGLALFFPSPIREIVLISSLSGSLLYGSAYLLARNAYVTLSAWIVIGVLVVLPIVQAIAIDSVLIAPLLLSFALLAASLMLRARQIWLVLAAALGTFLIAARQLSDETAFEGSQFGLYLIVGAGLLMLASLSYLGARNNEQSLAAALEAKQAATEAAARITSLNRQLAQQVDERTDALQQALGDLQQQHAAQNRLLRELEQERRTVAALSIPVLPLGNGRLVAPLIGNLEGERMAAAMEHILQAIMQRRSKRLIVDVTGAAVIDSRVAAGLIDLVLAARLLGTQVTLVGIRPEVAQTLVALGVDLAMINVSATLQSALDGA